MHLFHPTHYYNSFGEHEPVLKIRDGDTVSTKTVDAGGWDERGDKVGVTTNPLTGPFHVEGTMPGDALEVRLESVIPNRNWAWSSNLLVPHVVSPQIAAAWPPSEVVRWKVDMSQELVYPEKPTAGLTNLKLAVRPFLGCFGLANPDGQALSSVTSGRHGGNMDYQGFGPRVTVLFPVFAEGALFYLGDGHARQGAGEVAGTGLEISMDVVFSVRIHKGKKIGWPRGESDTHRFCVGNAKPLEQAVQHATSEMLALLQEDYGLMLTEASLLLGQAVEYEVANVCNPAYSVVCKLPKALLFSM